MTRRSLTGAGKPMRNALLALAFGSVTVLLGCGGGGGGGVTPPPAQACGSAAGSVTPVVCGTVYENGSTTAVAGVTVVLRGSSGAEISRTTTAANGTFTFSPATSGTQIQVAPPSALYAANMAKFLANIYDFDQNRQDGLGKCYMLTRVKAGDTKMAPVYVFPVSVPPPPPMGGCPR